MHVLVVENMPNSFLGLVGTALAEAGAVLDVRRPFEGQSLPTDARDHDAMVVLGGEQSALDDDIFPYLPALAALMKRFSDQGRAVLGICLGSQLLARAHGAENHLGGTREFGWREVRLTPAGLADPVLAGAGAAFPIFEWHSDTFSLPANAIHLAENPVVAHQAFRIGRAAYGMQFHFEAGAEVVRRWKQIYADQIEQIDPTWLGRSHMLEAASGAAAEAAGLALARAWVRRIDRREQTNDAA